MFEEASKSSCHRYVQNSRLQWGTVLSRKSGQELVIRPRLLIQVKCEYKCSLLVHIVMTQSGARSRPGPAPNTHTYTHAHTRTHAHIVEHRARVSVNAEDNIGSPGIGFTRRALGPWSPPPSPGPRSASAGYEEIPHRKP